MTEQWSDWIPWAGGECPIPWAKAGEYGIRFRDGEENAISEHLSALGWCSDWWAHKAKNIDYNIVAYRYRLDRAPEGWTRP